MPDPQTSSAPALPSARSAQRPFLVRLSEGQWALTGLALALLVLLVLPSAQIKLGAAQLNGLIGSYTSGGGGWVPCDANGNPLPSGDPGLNSDGSAALLHTGNQPTASNTYPVPQTGAAPWWYGCYSPQAPGGGPYPTGGGSYPGSGGGLSTSSSAGNTTSPPNGGTIGFYDPNNYGGDRSDSGPLPPNLNGSVTTTGSDTLKARFLWTGPGPAPTQATFIIKTSVSASASVGYGSSGKTSGLSGTSTVTLGSDTVTATAGDAGSAGSQTGGSWQAQQASASGGIATVSLSASASTTTKNSLVYATWVPGDHDFYYAGPGAGQTRANASATAKGSVYPMSITLSGTTPDASGNLNILVGQGCIPSLSTIPHLFTASNPPAYLWNVSGTTFQSWSPTTPATATTPANPNASSYVPCSWPSQQAAPQWYWNDLQQTPETVSCTATVTPPAGQGSPFSFTATQKVTVQVPHLDSGVATGYMQINTSDSSFPGNYALWAGPAAGANWNGGILWQSRVQTPQTPVPFGLGSLEVVQLDTPNDSYTTNTNPVQTHTDPLNTSVHSKGLDLKYPYQSHVFAESTDPNASYLDGDAPGLQLTGFQVLVAGQPTTVVAASASFNGDYYDYLMYQPPSSGTTVSWVPLGTLHWSVTSSATLPDSKLWSDYVKVHGSDSAGTVNADQPKFKPDNTFPSWTIINTPQPY